MYIYEVPNPDDPWSKRFCCHARNQLNELREIYQQNREIFNLAIPVAIGCLTTTIKVVGRRINLKKEENLKKCYCYDRSLGHYWELRRELTNKEWLHVDQRKKNGERLSDILAEMKVLK